MKVNLKQEKGITLIALVITIVVLLILAGVTIAMLTGENGILGKATTAKNKNDEAIVEEKIKLSVMYARMNTNGDTDINLGELKKELNKNFNNDVDIQGEENTLPWRVTNNGYMFEITENGEVKKVNGIALDKNLIEVLQGSESQTLNVIYVTEERGNIVWESSNANVVTVTNGKLTFKAPGTATITVKMENTEYSATCEINVFLSAKNANISIPTNIEMKEGETKKFEITYNNSEENIEKIKYEYNPEGILEINKNNEMSTVTNLSQNQTVTVTVKGVLSGESIGQCIVNVVVDSTPPVFEKIALVENTEKEDGFTLEIEAKDEDTGVERFEIYNSEDDSLISTTTNVKIEDGTYKATINITGLKLGKKYNVYAKAVDKKGNISEKSEVISAETVNPNLLEYPILTSNGIMNCKNETGYYYDKDSECKAADALKLQAYDKDDRTYFKETSLDTFDQRLNINSDMLGRNIKILTGHDYQNYVYMNVIFVNNNGDEVADPNNTDKVYDSELNIQIPIDCKQIIFRFQKNAWINEIYITD